MSVRLAANATVGRSATHTPKNANHSRSSSSRAMSLAKSNLSPNLPFARRNFFSLKRQHTKSNSSDNHLRVSNRSSRPFSNGIQVPAEAWTTFLQEIDIYRKDDLLDQAAKITLEAVKCCLIRLDCPFSDSSSLVELASRLNDTLLRTLEQEKKQASHPLSTALSEIDLGANDFLYNEDLFFNQIAEPPHRPAYLVNLAQLLLSPSFNTQNRAPLMLQNEQFSLRNFSDINWTRYIGGLSFQSIVLPEEDTNVENKTFNQFACESVKATGTILRELAGGTGDRALALASTLPRQGKFPSAILASDINQFSVLIGNLALSVLKCPTVPIRIGLGHLSGEFYYPANLVHQDQVVLMSRAFTVCDGKTIRDIFQNLNRSLKTGNRVIASFAVPEGGVEYAKYQSLVKSDSNFEVEPMNNGLVGETFWQKSSLDPQVLAHYKRMIKNFEPRVAIHSFLDVKKNQTFFEKKGFEIQRHVRLSGADHPNNITNDREIVEFIKRKEIL